VSVFCEEADFGRNKNRGIFDQLNGPLKKAYSGECTVRNLQPSNNQQTRPHREKQTTHKVSVPAFLTQ